MNSSIYLLHGWGCDSTTWQPLIPFLENHFTVIALDLPGFGEAEPLEIFDENSVLQCLVNQIEDQSVVLGWSLGGNLAVQLAAKFPQKVSRLITLASNLKFVASDDYTCAMPISINKNFNASFAANPQATLKLFVGLMAQGDINERALLKQLRQQINSDSINHNWSQALELLSTLDNRAAYQVLNIPGLHLLAEKDALVPVACAIQLKQLNPSQQIEVIEDAAHAVHWSQPESVANKIINWEKGSEAFIGMEKTKNASVPFSKKRIAESFGRAVDTYDQAASLQQKVGLKLLSQLDSSSDIKTVLDLGCGTGYFLPHLQEKFSQAQVVGADIAEPMLKIKRGQSRDSDPFLFLVGADAESLPFANQSFDRIYSNFSLQWCFNLPELFAELERTLSLQGELVFTTLGDSSLHELKSAWQQVDNQVHVNNFFTAGHWQAAVQEKFSRVELRVETEICYFPDFKSLAKSLKMLGAHNLNDGRPRGLTGRKKIAALQMAYENFRTEQGLPITYEVIYCRATNID